MKKLILFLMTLMLAACSAPMPGEVEDVGEVQQELSCAITGDTGSGAFPALTVITDVRQAPPHPVYGDTHMIVTACDIVGGFCSSSHHAFSNVHWSNVNGTAWTGSVDFPLRRVEVEGPGCQLSAPSKWCMTLNGDNDLGDHVNLLQNVNRFLSDKPITAGVIEAPVGTGIAKITGVGSKWRMRYPNATNTSMKTQDWAFTSTACEL